MSYQRMSRSTHHVRFFPLQLFLLLSSLLIPSANSFSQIVISQVYGGGGNSGATYKNDYIELFNRGTAAVSLVGWTVQYASASGTGWESTSLNSSIEPGGYYLVQEAQGAGGTVSLPTPNAIGNTAMSATSAKIALVSNSVLLSGSCPSSSSIMDFVGYGSASCSEQTTALALTNTTALIRFNEGCTDTGSNGNDFRVDSPLPRNSSTALTPCGGVPASSNPVGAASASPQLVSPGTSVILTVAVTPGSNPTSTGITVTADLSSIGGPALQRFFDDGTQGDAVAGDSRFTFSASIGTLKVWYGAKSIPIIIADAQNRTATVNLPLTVGSLASETGLVFPQVATGGGWKTIFLLTNSTSNPATATLDFYSDSGTPMVVNINGALDFSFPITVPSNGSTSLVASSDFDSTTAGWAMITSPNGAELNGNAAFQFYNGSELISEASVPAVHPAASVDFYAEEEKGGFSTGIAIANPTSIAAEGLLTLRNKQGTIYATTPIILAPLAYKSSFLFQVIEGAETGRAQIEMSKGYVSALALRMNSSGVLSTISVSQPGYHTAGTAALFSPQGGVTQRIISGINNAQVSIDIAIYSFTSDAVRNALINAKNRGVEIRIIADSNQASGSGSEVATLEQAGFQVKRSAGGSGGIMHNKYMIIDGRTLFTGSFNWSANAEDNNFENAIFIQASPIIQKYQNDFNAIWAR